jgi:hypothetical protein
MLVTMLMFSLYVMTGDRHPVKQAQVQCEGITRFGTDDGAGVANGTLEADSDGRVVIEAPTGSYHCTAWKDGVGTWDGWIEVVRENQRISLVLKGDK